MPLSPGTRLGPYEVIAAIGQGGMGAVYRARDTKLGRDVALKILPDVFARDADRLARFEREARTLAALNHPNIAHIHGLEDSGTTQALVMELVPGSTLDELIERGALASVEALPIARQIAEALEVAHEQGIVHRDLKPANVKVTDSGVVKVLDFGLAKFNDLSGSGAEGPDSGLATRTSPALTQAGLILGTAAYMSPEQARGKAVDRRADIWAFGVVLYEMLTGRRLFDGETVSDVVAAVLTRPIDVGDLPGDVPAAVRTLVARCLERDPRRRLRDIGEARIALDGASASASTTSSISSALPETPAVTGEPRRRRKAVAPWIVAGGAVAMSAALLLQRIGDGSSAVSAGIPRIVAEIGPPSDSRFIVGSNAGGIQISPDGSAVLFLAMSPAGRRLYVRWLETGETRMLSGTDGAFYPFWSPDSRAIGFFANGKMFTLNIAGGLPEAIADALQGRGGAWSEAGDILFTPAGGGVIHRVPSRGGKVEQVTTLDASRGENAHYWPVALPGGRKFLYFVRSTRPENNGIYLGTIAGGVSVRLVAALSSAIYAAPAAPGATGHLLWVRDAELLAQAFDVESGQLSGDIETVASDVRVEESQRASFASVSMTGRLVWASARAGDYSFAWYDRSGLRGETLPIAAGKIMQPRISSDGMKLAFTRAARGTADVWVFDLTSGALTQVTTDLGYDELPFWAPDGKSIAHQGDVGDTAVMVSKLDGSGRVQLLPGQDLRLVSGNYLRDGRAVFLARPAGDGGELGIVQLDRPGTATWLTKEPGLAAQPTTSPDGRWLAFTTARTGRPEVVIGRLQQENGIYRLSENRMPVSTAGGTDPEWRADGREILYLAPDGRIMAVPVTMSGETIALGKPAALMRLDVDAGGWGSSWAPTPDHKKFVIVEAPHAQTQSFRLLTRWQ